MTKILAAVATLALLLSALPALAGDRAVFEPIGYSDDGRYFAFEEFGVADGSGLPFSSVSVIDLSTDASVKGSPLSAKAGIDLPGLPLADIRGQAAKAAAVTLKQLGIRKPAEYRVLLGDGVKADGKSLGWSTPNCCGPGSTEDAVSTLTLTTFAMPPTAECTGRIGQAPLGFALSLDGRELHRDANLPKSRGCTVDYRLYAVLAPFDSNDDLVAIVAYYPFGFEGADRRFLAVPIGN